MRPGTEPDDAATLRRRAEEAVRAQPARSNGSLSHDEALALVHELQVHQIELELQNEELVRTRREAEALRDRYADLYDFAPVGYFTLDGAGAIREANLAGAVQLGVDRESLVGAGFATFLNFESRYGFAAFLARVLAGGTTETCDVSFAARAGYGAWYAQLRGRAVAAGSAAFLRLVVTDITERRRAEDALRESEERQAFLLQLSDALRPLSDPVEVQEMAARVLGEHLGTARVAYFEVHGDEYVIGRDYTRSVPSMAGRYPVDSFSPRLLAVYRAGRTAVGDDTGADPDLSPEEKATFAAVQIRAYIGVPLVKAGAFVAGLAVHMATPREWTPAEVALVEETAERTWAAVERARAEAALREYAENLQRSNEDLERFAYVASHDLQEPLRSIVSFSQLLERRYRGQLGENADEYLDFIVEGGTRMQGLILDLLAFSRVNTTRQQIARTDAEDVFAEAVRALDVSLREAGATLTHDPLPVVMADPVQILQVFSNLVSNAVKFRRPDVPLQIHVGVRCADGFCEFSVRDNGIGIEEAYFDKIFVIFQRLHTKETYPGTGIGLAIVKRIIDRHGGKIWVESTPGEGSTFVFTLPAA